MNIVKFIISLFFVFIIGIMNLKVLGRERKLGKLKVIILSSFY